MAAYTSRAVERIIVDYAIEQSATPGGRVSVGLLTGPRSYRIDAVLSQGVVPKLRTIKDSPDAALEPVQLTGAWADHGAVHFCMSETDVPDTPPPVGLPLRVLLVVCSNVDSLPTWVTDESFSNARTLPVGPLSLLEAHRVMEAELGGNVHPVTSHRLASIAGFAAEPLSIITAESKSVGALVQVEGTWSLLADPVELALIPYLRAQLASVGEDYANTMFHLALLEPFDIDELDSGERQVASQLVRSGEVHRRRDGLYEFIAPAGAMALRRLAPPAALRRAHSPSLQLEKPDARALIWALEEGEFFPFNQLEHAAATQFQRGNWQAVTNLLDRSMSDPRWDALPPKVRSNLLVLKAKAWRYQGNLERAAQCLDLADTEVAGQRDSASEVDAGALIARADLLHYGLGRPDIALEILKSATLREADLRVISSLFVHYVAAGETQQARDLQSACAGLLAQSPPKLAHRVAIAGVFLQAGVGKPEKALADARALGSRGFIGPASGSPQQLELQAATILAALRAGGPKDFPQLETLVYGQGSRPRETELPLRYVLKATWEFEGGSISRAHEFAGKALQTAESLDTAGVRAAATALRAHTSALVGDRNAAAKLIENFRRLPFRASALVEGMVRGHVAAAQLLVGLPDAAQSLRDTAARFVRAEQYGFASDLLYSGVRFEKRRAARDLLAISGRLQGPVHGLRVRQAAALLDDDAMALFDVAEDLQTAGFTLYAAEAAAAALHLGGLPGSLRNRARLWVSLAASEQNLLGHSLLTGFSAPAKEAQLTPRELDVSHLIHAGLSNAEIASELGITVRTVEGHITRIYRKTGGTRRGPRRQ